jgi:hypothetical protein
LAEPDRSDLKAARSGKEESSKKAARKQQQKQQQKKAAEAARKKDHRKGWFSHEASARGAKGGSPADWTGCENRSVGPVLPDRRGLVAR